jgi:hypothetical protein
MHYFSPAYHKALALLLRPGARFVVTYTRKQPTGRMFSISPGGPISDAVGRSLLERRDLQPDDAGLFPGRPQSWRLGGRRSP